MTTSNDKADAVMGGGGGGGGVGIKQLSMEWESSKGKD